MKFVAHPEEVPPSGSLIYARPDDPSDRSGITWREVVDQINLDPPRDEARLWRAFELYGNPIYRELVETFGIKNVSILSAGWGLVRSDFMLPDYDITFTAQADSYIRRRKQDAYFDFNHLVAEDDGPTVFLGGKDYRPLLAELTGRVGGQKLLFHNSSVEPLLRGWTTRRYDSPTRTNWHYECAREIIRGNVSVQ